MAQPFIRLALAGQRFKWFPRPVLLSLRLLALPGQTRNADTAETVAYSSARYHARRERALWCGLECAGAGTMDHDNGSFGKQLRELRLRAGFSQSVLAERANLSPAAVATLERGVRSAPYPRTVDALAQALGLSTAERAGLIAAAHPAPRSRQAPAAVPEQPLVATLQLPVWLASFVGREDDVQAARALLDCDESTVRLLTFLGPGGVGKTRLAVAVASTLADRFANRVLFVDLVPLNDARLVPATIARALGLREGSGYSARDLLLDYLKTRRVLLVLDNFEHVLEAAPLVPEVLQHCPGVTMLVTSRTALRVQGEQRFVVAPLPTPPITPEPAAAATSGSPAVRLFVERAQAVVAEFDLHQGNASAVASICRQLDGIPLAIELAAARVALLSPETLLRRLERRLPVLTGGAQDLPRRQQTLRATLAWSHDLLEPATRLLLQRLAVFAGGWTLEAAESVCADATLPVDEVLDRLQALVDSSLVRRLDEPGDEPRFGMLETVREYALERLEPEEVVRNRHLAYFVELATQAEPLLHGPHQAEWADILERELDNFRAALTWSARGHEPRFGLQLATMLRYFWYAHGHHREGRDHLQAALVASKAEAEPAARARALEALGFLLAIQGQYREAYAPLEEALAMSRQLGDDTGIAFALRYLGVVSTGLAEYEAATTQLEESLALYRRLGVPDDIGLALMYLGDVVLQRGDLDRAGDLFEESSALMRHLGNKIVLPYPLRRSGELARLRGDMPRAVRCCVESLTCNRDVGERQGMAASLVGLALVADMQGQTDYAAQLLSKADALLAVIASQLLPFDRRQSELADARIRSQLAPAEWAAAWEAGRRLSLDEIISRAQAVV